MSSQNWKPTMKTRILHESPPPDLTLIGGKAFPGKSGAHDVTNYHTQFYHPGTLIDSFEHVPLQFRAPATSPALFVQHHKGVDDLDVCQGCCKLTNGNQPGIPSPETPDSRKGFFYSPSRPASASYSASALSKPSSSAVRQTPLPTRPPSAANRPTSNVTFYSENDPDHEPIHDVLSRLGDYTQNFSPESSLTYTDCDCSEEEKQVCNKLRKLYTKQRDGSDDSDEDDSAVTIDVLLKTFQNYEDKGQSSMRHKAMLTLLEGYVCDHTLSPDHLDKVFIFMKESIIDVQEASLILLKQIVKHPENLDQLLQKNIFEILISFLASPGFSSLRRQALLLLEVIFLHHNFQEKWLELAITKLLPKLISMVRGQMPLDVKYAACCVFRAFAQYEEFIVYVTEEILPTVIALRNASAKFKEVYVEILTALLSHTDCIPHDLVDSSAIPITVSIIKEGPCGPQCASLHLLSSLTNNDKGVAMVIGTNGLVPMVLCCMRESKCRNVRLNALEVMQILCTTRRLGLCRDLMLQLSTYLVPHIEQESLTNLSQATGPNGAAMRPRIDEERHMWQGLEKFIDLIKAIIFKEAKVKTDEMGLISSVNLRPGDDVYPAQLSILWHAFTILQTVCLWPLDKSRLGFSANRVDLTTFTDDDQQRLRLSKVNRGLTQAIWDKVGKVVTDLILSYAENFHQVCKKMTKCGQLMSLNTVFDKEEVDLINSLLELLLCSALCTCVAFPEIVPKLKEKSKRSKSPSKLKSSSAVQLDAYKKSSQVESGLRSQSDVGRGLNVDEGKKIWMKENPYLTGGHGSNSRDVALEKSKAELRHKEACTERRLLRKCLYESGVFNSVCPLLQCSDACVKVLVLQILRCLVQPLEERVAPKLTFGGNVPTLKGNRQRPQTAGAVQGGNNRRLNMALYKMSPDLAGLIKEALGPESVESAGDSNTGKASITNIPGNKGGLETIQERLQEFTETAIKENTEGQKNTSKKQETFSREKPMIDRCRPIAQQCREALLQGIGEALVGGIFNKSQLVRKYTVLLLHDVVSFGENEIHMGLSTHGCMPKLVDFLRVNEDNELLEIIGLIIVRILVASDQRLRQLFNRHGGPQLLLSMAQYTTGLLKQEVSHTLKSVSKADTPMRKRPVSAPVSRVERERAPDIWDHIQARWKQEDRVKHVLRQWIEEDRLNMRKISSK